MAKRQIFYLPLTFVITGLLVGVAPAGAQSSPGGACPTPGAVETLGSGQIVCIALNGSQTWQPYSGGGGGAPGAPTGSPTSGSSAAGPKKIKLYKPYGTALSQETFGSTTKQVADVTGVRLKNGTIRLYAFVKGMGIRSAVSTDKTGSEFTAEPGMRSIQEFWGQPRAVSLSDGRLRLFYLSGGAIKSAISDDGLTFSEEAGSRITTEQAGFEPGAITVVPVAGGGYRGYFSDLERPGVIADHKIVTATSPDMLTWTIGPTVVGEGSVGLVSAGGKHPFALAESKGKVRLFYQADIPGSEPELLTAVSDDGLKFKSERSLGIPRGADPDIVKLNKKKSLLFYGDEIDPTNGFGIKAAKSIG